MPRIILALAVLIATSTNAQYKADNVQYTTVFPEELCKTLMANPNFTLLDVRSQGEFDDTLSLSESLNIGHLKNALHIDVRQLPQRWKELLPYKDKPLFIYCSHSQRSRRASRLLADSGFTKVYNVNGGLTNFYNQGIESNPCAGFEIVTSVPYKIISPREFSMPSKGARPFYIIDLRKDSTFKGISLDEKTRAEGRLDGAVSMPFESFSANSLLPDKHILLVDDDNETSPKAAKILIDKGFKDVGILFGGMEGLNEYLVNANPRPKVKLTKFTGYDILSANEFRSMVMDKKDFALIDLRTKDEFANTSKNSWQNIGQVKTAVNIPSSELSASSQLPASKDQTIVVYGFNVQPHIFQSAKWLKDQGYKKVYILQDGIWGLRWTAHNIKGESDLADLVVNVPAVNE